MRCHGNFNLMFVRLFLLGAMTLMASPAWAALSISISEPANNAVVTPGQVIPVTVQMSGAVAGIYRVVISMEGDDTEIYEYDPFPPALYAILTVYYTIPNGSPNEMLTISASVYGYADDQANTSINVFILGPDTQAPTFGGIASATRLPGNQGALISWNAANDARTASDAIRYNVYYSTVANGVFSSPAGPSIIGQLSTTLPGLNPHTTYYVGVRAEDSAGNEDVNTKTLIVNPLPAAVESGSWELYE